jgi:murein DD-endopeptidase MepM/ murein hydrolase activator NlpD
MTVKIQSNVQERLRNPDAVREWRLAEFIHPAPSFRVALRRSQRLGGAGQIRAKVWDLTLKSFGLKKRFYIVLVSRDENGNLSKVPVPLRFAYVFVAAAVIGTFTIAGLTGSYSRMLIKTARFNQLRNDHDTLQKDYAHLEQQAHEKDVQAASLSSLATEVSALYGLTASKLAVPMGHMRGKSQAKSAGTASGALIADATSNFTDDNYYKSLDAFYSLRNSATSGAATRAIRGSSAFGQISGVDGSDLSIDAPSLWPVMGPITSSFGQRVDPVLGNGEGEFHTGVDISAPIGSPVRASADGVVKLAAVANGYGREVILDHGHNVETCYAHLSGLTVMAGQTVIRGQVIGYVGMTGRTTGPNLHYEVRIRNTPVNPHKYLRDTLAGLGTQTVAGL